ncbi:putrescine transporter subunit: periplasmic-binding component of ABC superfamily protein [Methyloligella halotolerans]|uniref:Putrescine transporter subunit: periplasmic-binding component of ABC superfamily protein n=1 Tax=Methyloligella halotolerans TaxID=1177755 RepID=A0A1E2RYP3_9HYPH|nr:extracellular solute-binding protein [Methyloligella halotolerans]ODA67169.1 putrescine transporter subunit: periplasmic-binding component of ABC superfamily protein [Methyloligella halotolerans]
MLAGALAALSASTLLMGQAPAVQVTEAPLTVVTWDGAYEESQRLAYFAPFTKETGIPITPDTYDGSLKAIKKAIAESGSADVIDVSSGVLRTLCDQKLLAPFDVAKLPPPARGEGDAATDPDTSAPVTTASTPAQADFIDDAVSTCGVASVAWAATVVFDKTGFEKNPPGKAADFFDTKAYPGKRALPKGPRYTLELALIADGVAPADVYSTLATPDGQARAFDALNKIRSDIVWWSNPATPLRLIRKGKAAMGIAYTGRIFRNAVEAPAQIGILWDGQVYDLDHWAIPKTSHRKAEAAEFIAFASKPERLAAHAALTAYGPARPSAIPLVGTHPVIGVDMKRFLPTAPKNFKTALHFDQLVGRARRRAG